MIYEKEGDSKRGEFRTVLSSSGIMLLRTSVEVGVNFLLSVMIVRELGQKALGSYIFAISLAALIYSFAGLGITDIVIRKIVKDQSGVRKLVSNGLAIRLFITFPIGFLTVYLLSHILQMEAVTQRVVWIVGMSVGFGFVTDLVYGVFRGVGRFEYHLLLSVVHKIGILSLGWVALLLGYGVLVIVSLFAAMQMTTMLFSLILMIRKVTPIRLGFDLTQWGSLIRQSIPLAFSGFSETVGNRSDIVLLGTIKNEEQVGIYGAAYNLYLGVGLLVYSLVVGAYPTLSKRSALSKRSGVTFFFRLAPLMLAATGIIALIGFILASQIISIVYDSNIPSATEPLRVLVFALVFFGIGRLSLATLTSMGLQRFVFWSTLIGAIVNVSVNLALIPRFGYMGASYSTLITEIIILTISVTFLLLKTKNGTSQLVMEISIK